MYIVSRSLLVLFSDCDCACWYLYRHRINNWSLDSCFLGFFSGVNAVHLYVYQLSMSISCSTTIVMDNRQVTMPSQKNIIYSICIGMTVE